MVERFLPKVRWVNFPWQMEVFPKFFAKRLSVRFDSLNDRQFVEMRIYLTTTLLLSAAYLLIVLITWSIYQISARKKRNKDGV